MTKLNHHFQKLTQSYLFPEIEKRLEMHSSQKISAPILNLGIGDVTHPLFPCVITALKDAADELGSIETFRGYGPSQGYAFLREAIAKNDYEGIQPDEIFISDGINTDISNFSEIFSSENKIAVMEPAYPVYVETNVMAGRTRPLLKTGGYGGVHYLVTDEKNNFQPEPPCYAVDLVYLCSPNNPTGVSLTRETLKKWVDYAHKYRAVILYDGAYEAFITSGAPRSIYEIEGAKEVAVEFRSFSKCAGFTSLRCSYTVVPKELQILDTGKLQSLNALWLRRQETKSNGVSYPIQKAALNLYTKEGKAALHQVAREYNARAKLLLEGLKQIGYSVYGGIDSPYVWCKTPPKIGSWEFFDFLLKNIHIVTLPGVGFGKTGDGYIRFSAFCDMKTIQEALLRFKALA